MDLFLRFEQHFALFAFSALDGFVDDAPGFLFGGTDLLFRNLFAVQNAGREENRAEHDCRDANDEA